MASHEMGYRKFIQFGNITEIYEYEKSIKRKGGINSLKAYRLQNPKAVNAGETNISLKSKRLKRSREYARSKGTYQRSQASVNRATNSFHRLVHHNNVEATRNNISITFCTLTFAYDINFKAANQAQKKFADSLRTTYPEIPVSYISVPELTKKGRYHFHLLIYGLPPQAVHNERKTRNIQRLFKRGYVDLLPTSYLSEGIAGYMGKYMAKALSSEKNEARRGYTSSRNIKKVRIAGTNSSTEENGIEMVICTLDATVQESTYDVPFLGTCRYKKIIKKV